MFTYRTIIQNIFFSLLLICAITTLQAQEIRRSEPTWWFGAAGAANLNFYSGTTQMLISSPLLKTHDPFHNGFESRSYIAVFGEYRPTRVWGGMLYVGFDDRRGSFDDIVAPSVPASLLVNINYLSIEPSLRIAPFSSGLYFFGGPRIGFNITHTFIYTEYAQNGTAISRRHEDLSDMHSVIISGQVGAGYDIALMSPNAKTQIDLSPFISFHPYFGQNPREGIDWNVATLRVGAALKFGSGKVIRRGVVPMAAEREVSFSVRAPKIVPVKRRVRETFPLRNYIFFDEGSSEVPSRYVMLTKDQATSFKEEQLQNEEPKNMSGRSGRQMNVYHNKLNVLGDRMRTNPDATVTLVGASAKGPEDGRALAESIKRYLVDVFGIDGGRITTEGRDKPKTPSEQPGGTLELTLLRAEDRRVDIESQSPNLLLETGGPSDMLKPVQINDLQVDPLDSHVIFYVTGAKELLSSWSLEITDAGGNVQRYGPSTREWESIPGNTILGNRNEGEYKVVLLGQTKSGRSFRKEGPVINLVRLEEPKPEGLRFSILFRFDRSDMIAMYEKFLTEKVASLIPDSGVVIIHGHTDIIGDEEYNSTLSQERADDVQRIIESATSDAGKHGVTFETYGFGADVRVAPFDNNLPEERCYNRTVIIDIVPAN